MEEAQGNFGLTLPRHIAEIDPIKMATYQMNICTISADHTQTHAHTHTQTHILTCTLSLTRMFF